MEDPNKSHKIVDSEYVPADEYKLELKTKVFDEGENPRMLLKANFRADQILLEITDSDPPYMIMIARADKDVMAFGACEKMKMMLIGLQNRLAAKKIDLTRGIQDIKNVIKGALPH